jgi:tetratricopeptide (TPR) repeat protein
LYFLHRYDEARQQCEKTLEMNGRYLSAHQYLYQIYLAEGSYPEAIEEYLTSERLRSGSKMTQETPDEKRLRQAFADGGVREFWTALAKMLSETGPEYYQVAQHYSRLGNREQAVYWLTQAFDNHDLDLAFVAADPVFDEYHIGRNDLPFLNNFLYGN